ncbi:MAG: Rieske 2Fe-2S domain-containing protein [Chloroflexota bacterium]
MTRAARTPCACTSGSRPRRSSRCNCHGGEYALDGTVLAGPPPKPLVKFALKDTGGVVTVDVPGDFVAPRESLPT